MTSSIKLFINRCLRGVKSLIDLYIEFVSITIKAKDPIIRPFGDPRITFNINSKYFFVIVHSLFNTLAVFFHWFLNSSFCSYTKAIPVLHNLNLFTLSTAYIWIWALIYLIISSKNGKYKPLLLKYYFYVVIWGGISFFLYYHISILLFIFLLLILFVVLYILSNIKMLTINRSIHIFTSILSLPLFLVLVCCFYLFYLVHLCFWGEPEVNLNKDLLSPSNLIIKKYALSSGLISKFYLLNSILLLLLVLLLILIIFIFHLFYIYYFN